jgi:hypothetical protein
MSPKEEEAAFLAGESPKWLLLKRWFEAISDLLQLT